MKHSADIEESTSKQAAWEKIKNDLIAAEKSIREEGTVSVDKMNVAEKSIREHGYYSEEEVEEELEKI